MKSDIDIVVENSREFEKTLRSDFGAKGRGLGELLDSLPDDQFPRALRYILRRIAHIRNAVVHDDKGLKHRDDFTDMCDAVRFDIERILSSRGSATKIKPEKAQPIEAGIMQPIKSIPSPSLASTHSLRKTAIPKVKIPAKLVQTRPVSITDCFKLLQYFQQNPNRLPVDEQALIDVIKTEYDISANSTSLRKIVNLLIANKYISLDRNLIITYNMRNIANV